MKSKLLAFLSPLIFLLTEAANTQTDYWHQTNGPFGANVSAMAATNDGVLFAGTTYGGMYRSTNNGALWQYVFGSPSGFQSYTAIVITGTGAILASIQPGGVYRSTNGGLTWTQSTTFSVSTFILLPNGNILARASGLYRSTNDGISWQQITGAPSGGLLVRTPSQTLIATVSGSGVYVSHDNGNVWVRTYQLNKDFQDLTVLPNGTIVASGRLNRAVFIKSEDDGQTWTDVTTWPLVNKPGSLGADSAGRLYAGPESHVSADNGASWTMIPSLDAILIWNYFFTPIDGFAYSGSIYRRGSSDTSWFKSEAGFINTQILSMTAPSESLVLAGSYGAIFRSTNRGDLWEDIRTFNNGTVVSLVGGDNGLAYAAVKDVGVYESSDAGLTWRLLAGSPNPNADVAITSTGSILAANWYANSGIWLSSDRGVTWWQRVYSHGVWSLSNEHGGYVYAGGEDSLFRSSDYGNTWVAVRAFNRASNILALSNGLVLIGGDANYGGDPGIYRSTNYGITWTLIAAGTGNVTSLTANSRGHIFAGTDSWGGILYSTDNGLSWVPLSSGIIFGTIRSLACSPDDYVFAGSVGGGVYRTVGPTTSISRLRSGIPVGFYLSQNYPNPFNPTTRIEFWLPERSLVNLKIFDMLGKEVAVLVNDVLQAGKYERVFDSRGLASGIYFYRMQCGSFFAVKKAVVLK